MMASPAGRCRTYSLHGFKVAIITVAFFSTLLLPKSDGSSVFFATSESEEYESKMVIGSKPPVCVNKCMKCRPCMATVVVPNHHQKKGFKVLTHGNDDDDDRYYLLSWKCRCGNKLFQP